MMKVMFDNTEIGNFSDNEDFPVTRHQAFIMSLEPPGIKNKRCNSNEWNNSMAKEWNGLVDNDKFELVDRPKDQKVIKVHKVFAYKRNDHNQIVSYKVRLVSKGYDQKI